MTEGMTCYERDETFCEDQMCLRTGCRLRNAALAPDQTTSQATALADKLCSINIWEGFLHAPLITGAERDLMVAALRGGAIAELETALTMCRDTNHVLREELKFISTKTIKACARVCDDVVTRAERLMEDPKAARDTLAAVTNGAMECAENIRALSQAPVTDGAPMREGSGDAGIADHPDLKKIYASVKSGDSA